MDEDLSKLKIDKADRTIRPRRRKKIASSGVAALCILALGFLYTQDVFTGATTVQVATVTQIYPSQTFTALNASGYVVPQRKSALASKVTGRLIWLGAEEGSRVKKDQVVARLESQDVAAAKNQAEANIGVAQSNIEHAEAELRDATLSLNRNKELASRGFIARSAYDNALARHEKAVAALAAAEATLKVNRAALESAKVLMGYTEIRAPFDAVVLTKNADIGDIVTPLGAAANAKAAVVTIADMNSLQVEADVSESNLTRMKPGQPCEIQLDAIPDARFRGAIHMIVPTADRSKATVMVKVRFIDKDPRILPEMTAKVAFLSRPVGTGEEKPRIAVNQGAVVSRKEKRVVFLVRENKAIETPVTLRENLGDMIEVIAGVKAGDQVVLNPPNHFRNGSRIKVAEK